MQLTPISARRRDRPFLGSGACGVCRPWSQRCPTFIGNDLEEQRSLARKNLALYTLFPFFQHLFRVSGITAEADQMENGVGAASLSDALLDAICLLGPIERSRAKLMEFREAGVHLPILMPPIGLEGARAVIDAFSTDAERSAPNDMASVAHGR